MATVGIAEESAWCKERQTFFLAQSRAPKQSEISSLAFERIVYYRSIAHNTEEKQHGGSWG